jgi:hypothetical protein
MKIDTNEKELLDSVQRGEWKSAQIRSWAPQSRLWSNRDFSS